MARFDVHRTSANDGSFLLICQGDALWDLSTKFVVPLIPVDAAPPRKTRLNPVFEIGGDDYAMVTEFAAAVPAATLGMHVTSLDKERDEIIRALDVLIGTA